MMIPSVAVDDVSKEQDSEESCYSQLVNLFCLRSTSNSNSTKPEDEESSLKTSTWIAPSKLKGVALSGTGDGDYFLRISFASLVSHRMRFLSESSEVAGRRAVEELTKVGGKGTGGAIVLDLEGKGEDEKVTKVRNDVKKTDKPSSDPNSSPLIFSIFPT